MPVALTLGLAIGGNAAIYAVVSAVLLKPLPYPEPERLVRLSSHHQRTADAALSAAEFHAFRDQTQVFVGVAGFYREGHEFRESAGPENLEGLFVTSGHFELLGARMRLGRAFTKVDGHRARDQVVLSERVWRARLAADPASSDASSIEKPLGARQVAGMSDTAWLACAEWATIAPPAFTEPTYEDTCRHGHAACTRRRVIPARAGPMGVGR